MIDWFDDIYKIFLLFNCLNNLRRSYSIFFLFLELVIYLCDLYNRIRKLLVGYSKVCEFY